MGGRGAASGIGKNPYGSQYHTLYKYENIRFVSNSVKAKRTEEYMCKLAEKI